MVVDGLDGLAARKYEVKTHVPRIDGYTLDLIIDFVTCIVIPVLFMLRFDMLPAQSVGRRSSPSFVMLMSALWMSRTDQMTADHFFNGFPCEWNMIVPTLYLLDMKPWPTAIACILLALTQLTNWKFLHPMQVRKFRPTTITVTVRMAGGRAVDDRRPARQQRRSARSCWSRARCTSSVSACGARSPALPVAAHEPCMPSTMHA